jgi:hypothetical protein
MGTNYKRNKHKTVLSKCQPKARNKIIYITKFHSNVNRTWKIEGLLSPI